MVQTLSTLHGGLFEDRDQYGSYITCMQCGFSKDMPGDQRSPLVVSAEPVPVPMAPQSEGSKRRRISHGGRHFSKTFEVKRVELTETAA